MIRQGLRSLIGRQDGMEVIAEASDGRQAVELAHQLKPDVIVMDISMPNLNGIEATRRILGESPATMIIALSMHADSEFVTRMFEAGARGYMLKDCAFEELIAAIHTVLSGRSFMSPGIAAAAGGQARAPADPTRTALSSLTPREREVLQLIAEGKSTKRVAGDLVVSVKTVETHRHNIMEKLGIHTVAELTKYAIRQGLTELE
jgi:DNA-binding NarL/FixJ family response regulator